MIFLTVYKFTFKPPFTALIKYKPPFKTLVKYKLPFKALIKYKPAFKALIKYKPALNSLLLFKKATYIYNKAWIKKIIIIRNLLISFRYYNKVIFKKVGIFSYVIVKIKKFIMFDKTSKLIKKILCTIDIIDYLIQIQKPFLTKNNVSLYYPFRVFYDLSTNTIYDTYLERVCENIYNTFIDLLDKKYKIKEITIYFDFIDKNNDFLRRKTRRQLINMFTFYKIEKIRSGVYKQNLNIDKNEFLINVESKIYDQLIIYKEKYKLFIPYTSWLVIEFNAKQFTI